MAQSFTLTVDKTLSETGQHCITLRGTGVFAGTYAAGGPTLNLVGIPGVNVKVGDPVSVRIWGTGVSDHTYGYDPGTNLTDGKVICTVTSTGAELADGAFPAAITGDFIRFEIVLPKYV